MPRLFLIPTDLGNADLIDPRLVETIAPIEYLIVERLRTARRFLRKIGDKRNFDEAIRWLELDKHNPNVKNIHKTLQEAKSKSQDVGVLSEAGNPCIADPGSVIVSIAHELNFEIQPLVGPSSILLALTGSGLNGQQFVFHGYLPVQQAARNKQIRTMEKAVNAYGATQLFMETPYRNMALWKALLNQLNLSTLLHVSCDLTLDTQWIKTKKVIDWKNEIIDLHKRPCIFAIGRKMRLK
tara:strand:- start:2703 stop:3419 length:717 start_codon:yes stop_codon:yes gene_type:complete